MKPHYHNENNPFMAQWLRNLIKAGHLPPGDVDERSIEEVDPDDLKPYVQCHFFAGLGAWSHALRAAGWADDRPIWTASCPCQPFSAAGKGEGFNDPRHLWPVLQRLIAERRPAVVTGEQVGSKNIDPWIDLVQADMEALGYPFAAVPFPSAGVGAPHIRDRIYWLSYNSVKHTAGELADTDSERGERGTGTGEQAGWDGAAHGECVVGLAHANGERQPTLPQHPSADSERDAEPRGEPAEREPEPGPVNGFWRAADWLFCTDHKWRPVEPGSQPLAHGLARSLGAMRPELRELVRVAGLDAASLKAAKAYRVGTLRGYGNAVNAEQAREFIQIAKDLLPEF